MNLDRRLLAQIRSSTRFALALAVLAGFLAGIAAIFQAHQISRIITSIFLQGQVLSGVWPLLWGLLAWIFLRAVLTYLSENAANAAALQVKNHLRETLLRHILALGPGYARGERSGELSSTITQGIEALDAYFSQYLPQLALAGLLPFAYLLVVFPLDPLSGVALLLTGPLIPFFMFLIGSTSQSLTSQQWTALGRMSAYFLDTLQGLTTLKALGRSQEQGARIARVSERYRETTMSVLRVTFLSALVLELLSTIGTAIVAVEVGLRLLYGQLGFELAFWVLLLAPDFYLPLRNLGLRFHASMSGLTAARRIFAILNQPLPASQTPSQNRAINLRQPFVIHFQHVSYRYEGRTEHALSDVSFQICSGQQVALVGSSGSGKSTLARLLLGFDQPQRGCIMIKDLPLAQTALQSWRDQIAWVPQQPYLFHDTLAANLRLARPNARNEELHHAAAAAHLLEWIDSLPQGLNTLIGEGGARLSGGQAQRLALARAFLRDAPFLILDEPSAHLDVHQEQLLQETLRSLSARRTVLVIAHRLSTVLHADQIIVLDSGSVVETGTHASLLTHNGPYRRLLRAYQGGEK